MNIEHNARYQDAQRTNQSNNWGANFEGTDTYPHIPWGKVAGYTILALGFLAAMCALAAVGA